MDLTGNKECSTLVEKTKGIFDLSFLKKQINDLKNVCNFNYFAFHSRAPTNSTETSWKYESTHPFNYDSYWVAHNGIISNFKKLEENQMFEVDSNIIPYFLSKTNNIEETYSKLEGLLTSWIFNHNNFYLVKAGSSLFINNLDFSSSYFENSTRLEEDGRIYKLEKDKFVLKNSFSFSNPYFL